MDVEAEVKALGTKLLALEGTIQKLAARREAAADTSLIDDIRKEMAAKSEQMEAMKTNLADLIAKLDAKEKNHVIHEPWWKSFGF